MKKLISLSRTFDDQLIEILCYYPDVKNRQDIAMKIESLKIENVGGISSLTLDKFHPNLNIICGENGIGKTNILDSIASLFSFFDSDYVNVKSGLNNGYLECKIDGCIKQRHINKKYINLIDKQCVNIGDFNLLYLKVNRVFDYNKEGSIHSDPTFSDRANRNAEGLDNSDIKQWFVSRYLHSAQINNLTETQQKNIALAKKCFSFLDSRFNFSRTNTLNEIIVETPTGEIYFELLSSGFKSILFILLGVIKEIEYRFQEHHVQASEFDGIILIDEIELHLHPEWQGKICNILTKTFPKAQFIVTTHSPHVVQTAEADQVIALSGQNGYLKKRTLDIAPNGFKGWTIEEILMDVMAMKDTRTELYREIKEKFDDALDNNDIKAATEAYQELDKLLHPTYPLRALFKMQLDKLKG